jgi:hypothetical protein
MIKKHGSKFVVTNKSGTKVLGTHPSKKKAAKQLAAIEISKAKHMQNENKRFKDFRNTLTESEYKETLTGYPNRGINTEDGPVNFGPERMAQINAMLNAISRSTFQSPNEAFIRIKTRLNLLMLDFPWTPYMWQDGGTGTVSLTVTLFGRVDGVDSVTGNVVMNGKANPTAGLKEFALVANIEIAEDGLYRVTAKLGPKTEPVVAEEGVEVDGDTIDEMAQTPARQRDMEHKIQRHDVKAQRGYEAKMNKTGKAAERGRKLEDKHDTAVRRLIARDTKEYESEKLYGRGGKIVKGKRKPVKEEVVDEMAQTPARVKEMQGKLDATASKIRNKVGDQPAAKKKYNSILSKDRNEFFAKKMYGKGGKVVKEAAEQIDELSKATKDAYVAKRGSQLSSMKYGSDKNYNSLTGKKQANAVKGIKTAMGGNKDKSKLPKLLPRMATFGEELVGGQKKLDVNKNKRLDSHDFALLRNKKKAVKEYTEMMPGIPLMQPDPTMSQADQTGKGKRFHKKALKSSMEEAAKKPVKKQDPHAGARTVIGQQKSIKKTLDQHGMRW